MKKSKILSLLGLVSLLTSCGNDSIYGVYNFMMGKESSGHFSISFELKKDLYVDDDPSIPENARIFTFNLDFDGMPNDIMDLIDGEIKGYYSVTKEEIAGETKINLGAKILDNVFGDFNGLVIPNEIVEMVFYATHIDDRLKLHIPVSLVDLQMQLVWYGYYIDSNFNFIKELDTDLLPAVSASTRIGSHPIKDSSKNIDQVQEMNEIFSREFSFNQIYEIDGLTPIGAVVRDENENYVVKFYDDKGLNTYVDYPVFMKTAVGDFDAEITISSSPNVVTKVVTESGIEIPMSRLYQKPFVFRDYYTVNLGLKK